MKTRSAVSLAAAALLAACNGDDDTTATPPPGGGATTGKITLRAAGPFGPHGGDPVRAALVRVSDSTTLDIKTATVAATNPAFELTFDPTVDLSTAHQVHYWVDYDNAAASLNGLCDDQPFDHQWSVAVPSGATLVSVVHDANWTNVCSTFTFQLTFQGVGPFGPHDGETFGAVLARGAAITSGAALEPAILGSVVTANPALSAAFGTRIFFTDPYSVKLWVDEVANGTCEGGDHMWSIDVNTAIGAPSTQSFLHTGAFNNVCSYFPP